MVYDGAFGIVKNREHSGNKILLEGNTWHDTYWGMDLRTHEGENHLGRILMKIRWELREKS